MLENIHETLMVILLTTILIATLFDSKNVTDRAAFALGLSLIISGTGTIALAFWRIWA